MKIFSIRAGYPFTDLPHLKTLARLGLKREQLSERLKGRIRLLHKYIDLALKRGRFEEEEESLWAFSGRISTEIISNTESK